MPKATLSFDLPQELTEYHITSHAMDWHSVLCDLDEKLRTNIKHEDGKLTAASIRDLLWAELRERGLDLYE